MVSEKAEEMSELVRGAENPIALRILYATKIEEIQLSCNPDDPLKPDDPRRADLNQLRNVKPILLRNCLFRNPDPTRKKHCLLAGHRGSGKSTELLSLQQWASEQGWLPIRTEVNARFGSVQIVFSDLYLLAITVVSIALDAEGIKLDPTLQRQFLEWFAEKTLLDENKVKSEISLEMGAELKSAIPFVGGFFGKFLASIKGSSDHAISVRTAIQNFPDQLIDRATDFLDAANEAVKRKYPRGILLMFDNLDRYEPEVVDRLLVTNHDQITRLACDTVFTYNIALDYKNISGDLGSLYDARFTIPTLAMRERHSEWGATVEDSEYKKDVIDSIREMMGKRLNISALFERPEDANLLIKMSGGSIRDMMRLFNAAALYAEGSVITSENVRDAIQERRKDYVKRLLGSSKDYSLLVSVAKRLPFEADQDETNQIQKLLFSRHLLEYESEGENFYDINPILLEDREFQRVCKCS